MSNGWNEDDTEKLIVLYEQYQCLWNRFHPEFNNKLTRYNAYKEIYNSINISNVTIYDCIERITNLKKEYCYELSKITAAIFYEKLYAPKAKWFKKLHILLFPYVSLSQFTNNFKKQNNNMQQFISCNASDNCVHALFDKSESELICSNDNCGIYKFQEIEPHLTLRNSIYRGQKLQNASMVSKAIKTVDVETGPNSNVMVERGTQTDILDEQKYFPLCVDKKKADIQDHSTRLDNIPVKVSGTRKGEDNFDIFGKSIAFQLRNIDIQTAVELEKKIENLITKKRLKFLESKLINQNSNSICCCNCNDHKITCKDDICNCDLALKKFLLLMEINGRKDTFCYK